MPDPKTFEEYNALSAKNIRIEGFGLDVCTVLCCPFCAASDFLIFPVTAAMDGYKELSKPVTCGACKRIARLDINHSPSSSTMGIVFMGGPEPPSWLPRIWTRENEPVNPVAGCTLHTPDTEKRP